ncbi:hypothetical protein [Dinoroseobacter sp. S375]|uniref:hypothetical protein n=1 Tax=Dinoroseobacter sp. S375 TaxID=3415136 RepID=UPI003C7C35B1
MRRLTASALLIASLASPASAALLCMGSDPHFLMTIDGGDVVFDPLGTDTLTLIPPVDESEVLRSTRTHILETPERNLPLLLKPESCQVLSTTLPLSLEILVNTDDGPRSFRGCCLIR